MKALILVGGFGTRLKGIAGDLPKPMVHILGKPFLEHQIRYLKEQEITEIILATHYRSDSIKSHFGRGHRWGVDMVYSEEETPLGTAGAIKNAEKYLQDPLFLVLNGDTYSRIDYKAFIGFHQSRQSDFTMSLAHSSDASHFGNVVIREDKVLEFDEKPNQASPLVNRGIYLFSQKIFENIEQNRKVSLEEQVFPDLAKQGLLYGYDCGSYFIDIGRPETYNQFKKDLIEDACIPRWGKVRDALSKIVSNKLDIVLVVDDGERLCGVLTDRSIKEYLLRKGNLEDRVEQAMIVDPRVSNINDAQEVRSELIDSGINHLPIVDDGRRVLDIEFRNEYGAREKYKTLRGKSPLRISFGGGVTDLPYYFERYGGAVISTTIDKYVHATITKRADSKVLLNSDSEGEIVFDIRDELKYDGQYDIAKATIKVIKPDFGFELHLHNDLPPGRGLGSSTSLTVLIATLLNSLQGEQCGNYRLAELSHRIEREELGIRGGWQDQYAAVLGGFNYMEFTRGKKISFPLSLEEDVINELNERLLLFYVGQSHSSGDIHRVQESSFKQNEETNVKRLDELKRIAIEMRDSLATSELERFGQLLHESWLVKKSLTDVTTTDTIDRLYELGLHTGAMGGKLLGAGGGGYLLFYVNPKKINQVTKAIKDNGGENLGFNFEFGGTRTWEVSGIF